MPKLSVLMPAYNCEAYVREAVNSILGQDFRDFELVIVEDGSTDSTLQVLESIADPRIRILRNTKNLGLIAALNRGIEACAGEYIARMDADDIARPERLRLQLAYMESHATCVCLGAWYRVMGTGEVVEYPESDEAARIRMLSGSPVAHPTAMLRSSALEGLRYDAEYPHAEDYKLWSDLALRGKLANLPLVLLDYRSHSAQVSQRFSEQQYRTADRVRVDQLRRLGLEDGESNAERHLKFLSGSDALGFREAIDWGVVLIRANAESRYLPEPCFTDYVLTKVATIVGSEHDRNIVIIALKRLKRSLSRKRRS